MPNVSLEPGDKLLTEKDILSATDDGVYVKGDASYSIDHQRYNFQFSGQTFWEVKHGRITTQLRDLAYQSNTPEFWRSCDMLGDKIERPSSAGRFTDGKGQPSQNNAVRRGYSDRPVCAHQHPEHWTVAMLWTKDDVQALTNRVLAFSKAEETVVTFTANEKGNVRFARNSVTTAGSASSASLVITATFGKKSGAVTTSEFDEPSLRRAVRSAENIAQLSPENAKNMPAVGQVSVMKPRRHIPKMRRTRPPNGVLIPSSPPSAWQNERKSSPQDSSRRPAPCRH